MSLEGRTPLPPPLEGVRRAAGGGYALLVELPADGPGAPPAVLHVEGWPSRADAGIARDLALLWAALQRGAAPAQLAQLPLSLPLALYQEQGMLELLEEEIESPEELEQELGLLTEDLCALPAGSGGGGGSLESGGAARAAADAALGAPSNPGQAGEALASSAAAAGLQGTAGAMKGRAVSTVWARCSAGWWGRTMADYMLKKSRLIVPGELA